MNEGNLAHGQGSSQVPLRFVASGKAILDRWIRFVVVKINKHPPTDIPDGISEVVVERPPKVTRLIVYKPPPILFDSDRVPMVKGRQEMAVEPTLFWEERVVIAVCLTPIRICGQRNVFNINFDDGFELG